MFSAVFQLMLGQFKQGVFCCIVVSTILFWGTLKLNISILRYIVLRKQSKHMQNWLLNEKLVGATVVYKGLSLYFLFSCVSHCHTSMRLSWFIHVLSLQLQLKLNWKYLCLWFPKKLSHQQQLWVAITFIW